MGQYLDKFRGTIRNRQADQVLKLLNKQRNAGQVRSIEDFNRRLDDLLRELTSTVIQPTFKLFTVEGNDLLSSEQYNFMLDRVEDDLQAAFEEANNVDEVQRSHEAIIRDVLLKNLRAGVNELESRVSLYEVINSGNDGFDSAIFSTFRESKEGRLQRGLTNIATFFVDPRTGDAVPSSQDAGIDLVGERLLLGDDIRKWYTIQGIRQVFDSSSPQSDKLVTPANVSLRNVIDGRKGTYWFQSLLFKEKPTYAKTQIELDFGITREVNVLEIEPVTIQGLYLESVFYLNGSGVFTELLSPDLAITSVTSVQIRRTATRKLVLTFRNENVIDADFEHLNADSLLDQSVRELNKEFLDPSLDSVNEELYPLVGSEEIREITGVEQPARSEWSGYSINTGFDNIRVGFTTYDIKSIYVSTPLKANGNGIMGLRTVESRPFVDPADSLIKFTDTTYDVSTDDLYLGSIEYWVVRQEFDAEDVLTRTTTFPILPIGINRVVHERLVLTDKSTASLKDNDLGSLMFYTVNDSDGDIVIYRNGIIFPNVDSQPVGTEGWLTDQITLTDQTPNAGSSMQFKVRVVGQLTGDIFTTSYNPVASSSSTIPAPPYSAFTAISGLQVVDLVGDLSARRITRQLVALSGEEGSTSNFHLVAILRQNTAETSLSPAIEEFSLLAGKTDPSKFEGF